MIYIRLSILCLAILCFTYSPVYAQDMELPPESLLYPRDESKYNDITELKGYIGILVRDNQALEVEYKQLQREFEKLQADVEEYKEVLGINYQNRERIKRFVKKPEYTIRAEKGDIEALRSELLIKKSKNVYLRGELIDLEEKEQLWDLRLSDLKFEKRQLRLGLKNNEYLLRKDYLLNTNSVEALQTQLKRNLEKEKELQAYIQEMNSAVQNMAVYMPKIEKEIGFLELDIVELEKRKNLKVKEVGILRDKQLYASRLHEDPLLLKKREREDLEKLIRELEKEYDKLNINVEESFDVQRRKREIYKEVIQIDKENVQLRRKIVDLQNQIDASL